MSLSRRSFFLRSAAALVGAALAAFLPKAQPKPKPKPKRFAKGGIMKSPRYAMLGAHDTSEAMIPLGTNGAVWIQRTSPKWLVCPNTVRT